MLKNIESLYRQQLNRPSVGYLNLSGHHLNQFRENPELSSGSGKLPESSSGAFHIELVQVIYLNFQVIYLNLFKSVYVIDIFCRLYCICLYCVMKTETYLFDTYHVHVLLTSIQQDSCTEIKSSRKRFKMEHVHQRSRITTDTVQPRLQYRLQMLRHTDPCASSGFLCNYCTTVP